MTEKEWDGELKDKIYDTFVNIIDEDTDKITILMELIDEDRKHQQSETLKRVPEWVMWVYKKAHKAHDFGFSLTPEGLELYAKEYGGHLDMETLIDFYTKDLIKDKLKDK